MGSRDGNQPTAGKSLEANPGIINRSFPFPVLAGHQGKKYPVNPENPACPQGVNNSFYRPKVGTNTYENRYKYRLKDP
jgi:hypothetical protein